MKTLQQIICENLIFLRKSNKMTQMELGNQVGFSDKAISRWEKGEVTPDVETFEMLSKLYQVPVTYFFQEHKPNDKIDTIKNNITLIEILSIFVIWTVIVVWFVILKWRFPEQPVKWQLFILGVPLSCIDILFFNYRYQKGNWLYLLTSSIFVWSLITYIFLSLTSDYWILFLIGVPIQAIIISIFMIKKRISRK